MARAQQVGAVARAAVGIFRVWGALCERPALQRVGTRHGGGTKFKCGLGPPHLANLSARSGTNSVSIFGGSFSLYSNRQICRRVHEPARLRGCCLRFRGGFRRLVDEKSHRSKPRGQDSAARSSPSHKVTYHLGCGMGRSRIIGARRSPCRHRIRTGRRRHQRNWCDCRRLHRPFREQLVSSQNRKRRIKSVAKKISSGLKK